MVRFTERLKIFSSTDNPYELSKLEKKVNLWIERIKDKCVIIERKVAPIKNSIGIFVFYKRIPNSKIEEGDVDLED